MLVINYSEDCVSQLVIFIQHITVGNVHTTYDGW